MACRTAYGPHVLTLLLLLFTLAMQGCASSTGPTRVEGLTRHAPVKIEPWTYGAVAGHIQTTEHYRIFTTVPDDDPLFETLPQLLEGAYTQYRQVAPGVVPSDRPMDCYIFGTRSEWVEFTRKATGARAAVYLQIAYGAYALGDVFVAYDIGDYRTLSVTAHEGWHQFAARHFVGRLPPFLEEGVATVFEDVDAFKSLPRWNLKVNANRAQGLRRTIEGHFSFPLDQLVTLDAGDIIHRPGDRIDAFYSQNWAFARLMLDGDNGAHRDAFRRLLADVATGTVWGMTPGRAAGEWSKSSIGPILEHYLGLPMAELSQKYDAFCREVAFRDYMYQFE